VRAAPLPSIAQPHHGPSFPEPQKNPFASVAMISYEHVVLSGRLQEVVSAHGMHDYGTPASLTPVFFFFFFFAFQPQPLVLRTHQTSTHPLRLLSILLGRLITHVDVKCNIVSAHVRVLTWPRFVHTDINTQIHQRATENSFRSGAQQLHNGKWTVLVMSSPH
jgi:hypothetical protein